MYKMFNFLNNYFKLILLLRNKKFYLNLISKNKKLFKLFLFQLCYISNKKKYIFLCEFILV
jgi:hypothetical protein